MQVISSAEYWNVSLMRILLNQWQINLFLSFWNTILFIGTWTVTYYPIKRLVRYWATIVEQKYRYRTQDNWITDNKSTCQSFKSHGKREWWKLYEMKLNQSYLIYLINYLYGSTILSICTQWSYYAIKRLVSCWATTILISRTNIYMIRLPTFG